MPRVNRVKSKTVHLRVSPKTKILLAWLAESSSNTQTAVLEELVENAVCVSTGMTLEQIYNLQFDKGKIE